MKYVKVIDGLKSNAGNFEYKLGEVNIANHWNSKANNPRDFGGFNYSDEKSIIRWLHRGTYIYEVEIPEDAETVKLEGATTVYRTNKIIIKNPKKVDDDLALHLYKISNIPEKSYYKTLGVVAIMDYEKTARAILHDKVNKNNIDVVLEEWNDFIEHGGKKDREKLTGIRKEIDDELNRIKNNK